VKGSKDDYTISLSLSNKMLQQTVIMAGSHCNLVDVICSVFLQASSVARDALKG
jgi:hypothetical protein